MVPRVVPAHIFILVLRAVVLVGHPQGTALVLVVQEGVVGVYLGIVLEGVHSDALVRAGGVVIGGLGVALLLGDGGVAVIAVVECVRGSDGQGAVGGNLVAGKPRGHGLGLGCSRSGGEAHDAAFEGLGLGRIVPCSLNRQIGYIIIGSTCDKPAELCRDTTVICCRIEAFGQRTR